MQPLIEEAAKKASVAWLTAPAGGAAYPVWCVWADGALYVVSGPGEQQAPGLAEAAAGQPGAGAGQPGGARVTVTLRGDHGGRVVAWPAEVSVLAPSDERWATLAPQLAGKRLNAAGGAEQTVERWAAECRVYQLTPSGDASEAGATLPDTDLATQVRATPAARPVGRPFRLHRVRRR